MSPFLYNKHYHDQPDKVSNYNARCSKPCEMGRRSTALRRSYSESVFVVKGSGAQKVGGISG